MPIEHRGPAEVAKELCAGAVRTCRPHGLFAGLHGSYGLLEVPLRRAVVPRRTGRMTASRRLLFAVDPRHTVRRVLGRVVHRAPGAGLAVWLGADPVRHEFPGEPHVVDATSLDPTCRRTLEGFLHAPRHSRDEAPRRDLRPLEHDRASRQDALRAHDRRPVESPRSSRRRYGLRGCSSRTWLHDPR